MIIPCIQYVMHSFQFSCSMLSRMINKKVIIIWKQTINSKDDDDKCDSDICMYNMESIESTQSIPNLHCCWKCQCCHVILSSLILKRCWIGIKVAHRIFLFEYYMYALIIHGWYNSWTLNIEHETWRLFAIVFLKIPFWSSFLRIVIAYFAILSNQIEKRKKKICLQFPYWKYAMFRIIWFQLFIWEWIINWCWNRTGRKTICILTISSLGREWN